MSTKQPFIKPVVLQELNLLPGSSVLTGSVVDNTTVVSTGQAVENYDFSPANTGGFNHDWE